MEQQGPASFIISSLYINVQDSLATTLHAAQIRSSSTGCDSKANRDTRPTAKLKRVVLIKNGSPNATPKMAMPDLRDTIEQSNGAIVSREGRRSFFIQCTYNGTLEVERLPAGEANSRAQLPEPAPRVHGETVPEFIGKAVGAGRFIASLASGSILELEEIGQCSRARNRGLLPLVTGYPLKLGGSDTLCTFLSPKLNPKP